MSLLWDDSKPEFLRAECFVPGYGWLVMLIQWHLDSVAELKVTKTAVIFPESVDHAPEVIRDAFLFQETSRADLIESIKEFFNKFADAIQKRFDSPGESDPTVLLPNFVVLNDGQLILCLKCGKISHNPNDVTNRFCGECGYLSL